MKLRDWWKRVDKNERVRVAEMAGMSLGTLYQIAFSDQTTTYSKAKRLYDALHGAVEMDELCKLEIYGAK